MRGDFARGVQQDGWWLKDKMMQPRAWLHRRVMQLVDMNGRLTQTKTGELATVKGLR
jgi:hypothetical protein